MPRRSRQEVAMSDENREKLSEEQIDAALDAGERMIRLATTELPTVSRKLLCDLAAAVRQLRAELGAAEERLTDAGILRLARDHTKIGVERDSLAQQLEQEKADSEKVRADCATLREAFGKRGHAGFCCIHYA